jgi:PAS domain S-box-containing protein
MSDNAISVQAVAQTFPSDPINRDATSIQAQYIPMFKLGIERSSEAIFLTDLAGKILYVNPAFEKIYGYSQEEVIGKTPRILKSGVITQENYAAFWGRLLNKEVVSGEMINKTKDGHQVVIDASANPVLDDRGQIIGFLAIQKDITKRKKVEEAFRADNGEMLECFENRILTKTGEIRNIAWHNTITRNTEGNVVHTLSSGEDITERKRTEEVLLESEKRFRGVFNNATIGLYRTTPQGQILMANPALIRMLGYNSFEDLVKRSLEECGHSHQYPRSVFNKMMENVGVVHGHESAWKKADGSFIQVLESACAIKDENGKVVYYEGTVEDITDRKKTEEALRASEERYKLLVDNAQDAIFVIQNQKIIFTNYKISKSIGYDENEIVNKPFFDLVHPDDKAAVVQRHIARMAGEQVESASIFRVLHKDGSTRWLELNAVNIEWQGKPATLNFGRDITLRVQADKAIIDSELRHRILFENMMEGLAYCEMIYDEKGSPIDWVYLDVNSAFERLTGMKDVIGKKVTELLPGVKEATPELFEIYGRVASTGCPETFEINFKLLSSWLHISTYSPSKGHFVAVFENITGRKQAEAQLQIEKAYFEQLFVTAPEAIVIGNTNGEVIRTNPEFTRMFGYLQEEAIGNLIDDLLAPGEHRQEATLLTERAAYGETICCEGVRYRKDGQPVYVSILGTPVRIGADQIAVYAIYRDITEQKNAEEALRHSERFLKDVFDGIQDGLCVIDRELNILHVNKAEEIKYSQRMPLVGKKCFQVYHDRTAPCDLCPTIRAMESGIPQMNRLPLEGPGRITGWLDVYAYPMMDADGKIIGVIENARDVTEKKAAEELIQARTLFLAQLVGLTDASELAALAFQHVRHFMPIDAGALTIAYNNQAEYELVFSADTDDSGRLAITTNRGYISMDSNTSTDRVFRNGLKLIIHRTEEEANQIIPYNYSMPAYNDRVSRSLAYFPLIVHGNTLGVFSLLSYQPEIFTESRINLLESIMADLALALTAIRMTEALKTSEEKYRNLVETMPNGMIIIDLDFKINFANPMACEMCGYPVDEILKMNFSKFVHRDSLGIFLEQMQKRRNGESGEYEIQITRGDGENRTILIMGAPLRDHSGAVSGSIGISSDVTDVRKSEIERQELREKLARAQRMESLGVLAGGVAHDLNNILGPLVAYPELIRMKLPPDSPIIKQITKIESSAQRAAEVVQDLLSMARRGRYEMRPINLNKVIESYLQSPDFFDLKLRFPGVSLNLELCGDNRLVYGSETHLYKVVMNLVLNAMDAMQHGGILTIKTECTQIDKLIGGYDNIEAGLYNILTVSDTGVGIETKDYKRLFEPFYTKKEMGKSGSGLGLAIVYGVVKDHNGYIDVRSETNHGSDFTVYIPATSDTVEGEEHEPYSIKGNERILIVDDIPEQRELAVTILGSLGYNAECVPDGHAAVEYLQTRTVDVVVLDMIMEPGFDGLDTYRGILEIHPGQKAVITSGFSETDRVRDAERLGVGKYIRKPYTMQKLGKAIREVLDFPAVVHA